jgi:hypothetical protein
MGFVNAMPSREASLTRSGKVTTTTQILAPEITISDLKK